MYKFYLQCAVYFVCFFFALYGLSALDFNRFLKKGKVSQANILYIIIAMICAYLLGEFLMAISYSFSI